MWPNLLPLHAPLPEFPSPVFSSFTCRFVSVFMFTHRPAFASLPSLPVINSTCLPFMHYYWSSHHLPYISLPLTIIPKHLPVISSTSSPLYLTYLLSSLPSLHALLPESPLPVWLLSDFSIQFFAFNCHFVELFSPCQAYLPSSLPSPQAHLPESPSCLPSV